MNGTLDQTQFSQRELEQRRTFTGSQQTLRFLQQKYGTANYAEWNNLRRTRYSYVDYLAAGATSYSFFGDVPGQSGVTLQNTNLRKAGSFGQTHFLLKQICMDIRIPDPKWELALANDADTLYSDLVNGFAQSGVLTLQLNGQKYLEIPRPFLFAPPADGRKAIQPIGLTSLTLAEAGPNTLDALITAPPSATLDGRRDNGFMVDPNILIESEVALDVELSFGNAVSLIATDVNNDSTNALQIGVLFEGIEFRPVT